MVATDAAGNTIHYAITATQYYLNGSTILTQITGDDRFDFFYDENGLLLGFSYNGAKYYYIRNLQSDIIGILDNSGNQVVSYMYDSWGKLLSIEGSAKDTIGVLNPFRYRGYYYDTETGFYYLNSRYYDPVVGRYINADGFVSTNQGISEHNMFAYCANNPIMRADPSGCFWEEIGAFFGNLGNQISSWAKDVFGAGRTKSVIVDTGGYVVPPPSPITFKTGSRTTKTIEEDGDSSKPISVYHNNNIPVKSSSVGLKINIQNVTINFSIGWDNTGITASYKDGDTTYAAGLKLNISEFTLGVEGSVTHWDREPPLTEYTNISLNASILVYAYLSSAGQINSAPSGAQNPAYGT